MYYYITSIKNNVVKPIRKITKDEYEYLNERISLIDKMMTDRCRIDDVNKSYQNLLRKYEEYSCSTNSREISREFNRNISAYLGAFKKYLDNWQTAITREYKKNSEELKCFKKAFSEEYDNHMEYRIMYRLRNYDQHCGNIISNISVSIEDAQHIVYKIYMDREYLLENFSEWKAEEKNYLLKCGKMIEVLPIIKIFHQCILRGHKKIIDMFLNKKNCKYCIEILDFTKEIIESGQICIWTQENELRRSITAERNFTVNLVVINRRLYIEILKEYIRINQDIVKIFYYGKRNREHLSDCAFFLERDDFETNEKNNLGVSINGKKYICMFSKNWIFIREFYGIYVDVNIETSKRNKLCEEFKNI